MKYVQRIISFLLALVMVFGMVPSMEVRAKEAEPIAEQVMKTTVPEEPAAETTMPIEVTRAQWIQALVEAFCMYVEEDNYPDNYYSDLTGEEAYYRDIMVAVEFGVIDLDAGLPFRPEEAATREFAAHTLNFALGFQLGEGASYTFAESAAVKYPNDIQIAVDRGWFALADGKFLPEQAITAAEKNAMLTDAETVLLESEVDDEYESVYSFTTEVIEIPDGTEVKYYENYVVIYDCPVALEPGTVFAVYFNGLPCLYLAGAVTVNGNETTINVTELEEGEYYQNIDAQGVVDAKFTEFEVLEGTEVIYIDEDTGTEYADPEVAEYAIRSRGKLEANRTLSVKRELTFAGVSGYVSVKMKNPKIVYDISHASVSVKLVAKLETTYGVSCDFIKLQSFEPIPIIKWVAPGVGGLTVSIVLETKASLEGTTSGNLTVGAEYRGGEGFRLVHDFQKTAFAMVLKLSGKVGVEAKFGITDLPGDVLEGYIFAEVGGTGEIEHRTYEGNFVCTHAAIYMYAERGATLSVQLALYKKTFEDKCEIWNDSNSPIRIVHHYENGVLVPGCTRDGSGKVNNGYYTSTDSPYWGSNWSDGDNSTGYNSKGEPIMLFGYSLDEDNNATITSYSGNANALVIPETIDGYPIIAIGYQAFAGRKELVTVDIPDVVTSIAAGAFANCTSLQSVVLPSNLTTMGAHAFYNCDSLASIEIPKKLEQTTDAYIYEYAYGYVLGPFYGCDGLKTVIFEKGTSVVANGLFANCPGIRNITIPDTVTIVESDAFYNCANLQSVTLPAALTKIEGKAFAECGSLKNVTIPDTVTEICAGAFANGGSLESVVLPKNLTTMGAHAFYNCDSLTSIEIPKKLEQTTDAYFHEYAYGYVLGPFYGCDGLKNVTFEEGIPVIANGLFANCPGIENIVVPDSVTELENDAFYKCENLESLTLSKALTKINTKACAECYSLKEIEIPDTVTEICAGAFANAESLESVVLSKNLTTLGVHAFYNCDALTTIEIPKKLERTTDGYLNEYAYGYVYGPFYNCDGLKTATFEEGTKTIANELFRKCAGLETIVIPDTVTSIGNAAFQYTGLKEIVIPDTVTSTGNHILADCPNLEKITWTAGVSKIPEYTFAGSTKVKEVKIPDNVTTFYKGAFRDCDSLETIALPESLTQISAEAFYSCNSLREITIPDAVTTIESYAFYDCDALTTAALGKSVQNIGKAAFYDCDALTTVTMGNNVASMGASVFEHCDVLKNVTLSRNLTSIPEATFKQCNLLEEIVIPYYVTSIGNNAFNSSPKLAKVTMPRGLSSIGTGAFSYPATTVIYGVPDTYAQTWAEENGYKFVGCEITATNAVLEKTELTLNKGTSYALQLSVTPADSTDAISWKSSDTSIVTVSDMGVIKAVGNGTATVKVTVGKFSASCKVTVVQPVTSIYLNKYNASLEALATCQLEATINPSNANNKTVTWSSSEPSVATVNENGLVTALAKGTAVITVAAQDGSNVTRTCQITVTNTAYVAKTPDQMESSHDYPNSCKDFWIYTVEGAENLTVTFDEKTEMEDGFDYLFVYDGNGKLVGKYTGTELAGQSVVVPGDTVKIQLSTDDGGTAWGFKVKAVTSHNWKAATCTDPKTCTICGATEGTALGHNWNAATCTDPKTCARCGTTEGTTIPHKFDQEVVDAKYLASDGTYYKSCLCGEPGTETFTVGEQEPNGFKDVPKSAYFYDAAMWAVESGITTGTGDGSTFEPNAVCTRGQVVTFLWRAAGKPEPAITENPFKDVKSSDYFYKAVLWALENKITTGTGDGSTFEPNANCNRAQIVTFLSRAKNGQPTSSNNPFKDVAENAYYYNPVLWAVENGITTGTGDGTTFEPNANCTRGQVITFLWRAYTK